jgi:uncharacterized phage-associated protein
MHSPKAIANYFLDRSKEASRTMTQMKLHKLIYYAHGWCLGIADKPLINETVEAWKYGPVIRSLWDEFRDVGSKPIERRAYDVGFAPGTTKFVFNAPSVPPDDFSLPLLKRIWELYGPLSAVQLSQMTHEHGSPWSETWGKAQAEGVTMGVDIPNDLIRAYFKQKAEANRHAVKG